MVLFEILCEKIGQFPNIKEKSKKHVPSGPGSGFYFELFTEENPKILYNIFFLSEDGHYSAFFRKIEDFGFYTIVLKNQKFEIKKEDSFIINTFEKCLLDIE